MKAFVTGATGFLGGRLTQKLLARGDEVVALVRRDVDLGRARTVRGDLSDRGALRDAMSGCDDVFGNTRGAAVDETYERAPGDWVSAYDTRPGTQRQAAVQEEMIDRVSPRPVRLTIPPTLLGLATPAGPLIGMVMGTGPNLRELISAGAGVTYWATDAKARREIGYQPRDLAGGLATLDP